MKFSIVLVGLLAVFGTTYADFIGNQFELDTIEYKQRLFEDVINNTINGVFGFLANWDPIQVKEFNRQGLFHNIQVKNVYVGGFSKVYAPHILLNGLLKWTFQIKIKAPGVQQEVGSFNVTGPLFFGNGNARVNVENIRLSLNATINLGGLPIPQIAFQHSLGKVDVAVAGVYNDANLSAEITSLLQDGLTNQINSWKELLNRVLSISQQIINHIISGSF